MKATRTRCRNPRCRGNLPEPVDNPHAAFCTRGCWQQYHRTHCCVCERPIEQPKRGGERRLCKRRVCRLELDKWPAVYLPFGQSIQKQEIVSRNADKTALPLPRSVRHWRWQRVSAGDGDYELLDGQGKMVARVRQEGEQWWVASPRCSPDPPLESLDDARRRAISMALASLPEGVAENRAKNKTIIKAVLKERELYPSRFSDAGERYARGACSNGRQREPAASEHRGEMPDIPDFLKRTTQEVVPA